MKPRLIVFSLSSLAEKQVNPYISVSASLGCASEFAYLFSDYQKGNISYGDLLNRESNLLYYKYHEQFGHYPQKGDLEMFLPEVTLSSQWQTALSNINLPHITFAVISSGIYKSIHLDSFDGLIHPFNRFLYSEDGEFAKIVATVSGDKIEAFNRIVEKTHNQIIDTLLVVNDNNDSALCRYVLELGGSVCFIAHKNQAIDVPRYEKMHWIDTLDSFVDFVKSSEPVPYRRVPRYQLLAA
ncbi:hypothetical protein HGA91_04555 [candidate division WWE3 bacterium]|nr:hypothetical protein [candidate division WWE3 bacterium]